MKKMFYLILAGCLLAGTGLQARQQPQFDEADMKASEIAKAMFQNEKYFKGLDENEKAAICTGAIGSYQTCLSGEDAGAQTLEASKMLFEQVYGQADLYKAYFTAGELYGYLLSKTTQKCDSIGEFTNNSCQEMMLKNAQFIQEQLGKK